MDFLESWSRGDPPPGDVDSYGDDIDPRKFFERSGRDRGRDRKTRMLCSQVADRLQLIFESGLGDEDLQEVFLQDVEPFPDAGTLRVTVTILRPEAAGRIAAALERAAGHLRTEVAGAISRKRAPQLVFRVMAEGSE